MPRKSNIVYILEDHQAYYGHGEMVGGPQIHRPYFHALAQKGVEFTRAYTSCPLCGPARRSMLTGLFPHNHQEIKNESNHKYDKPLYFEGLTKSGYDNYYVGKWHAGPGDASTHHCIGFSQPNYGNPYLSKEYQDYLKRNNLPFLEVKVHHSFFRPQINENYGIKIGECYKPTFISNHEHITGLMTTPKESHAAFFLVDEAIQNLKKIAQKRRRGDSNPFHIALHFWGPHHPYYTTQEFLNLYNPEDIPQSPNYEYDMSEKPEIYQFDVNFPMSKNSRLIHPNPVKWETFQEVLAFNYAQQSLIDAAAGKFLKALTELGLDENTLIIWTSDHGDATGCHGGHFDKEVYMPEEMIRIPFVMTHPDRIPKNQKTDALISNIDLTPTFLDVAGIKFQHKMDGKSLFSVIEGGKDHWRSDLMVETHGNLTTHLGRALITDRFKYVYNENDRDELYDLDLDPYEKSNLIYSLDYQEILNDLKNRLNQWRAKTEDDISHTWIRGKKLKPPNHRR